VSEVGAMIISSGIFAEIEIGDSIWLPKQKSSWHQSSHLEPYESELPPKAGCARKIRISNILEVSSIFGWELTLILFKMWTLVP